MKEIFEAIESRVKSPLMGYFTLAFVAVNWKAIFFLLAEKSSAIDRISYFENNTNLNSLLGIPLTVAFLYTVIHPWIKYWVLWLCIKPTELKNVLQAKSEHNLLKEKQKLEVLRSNILSNAERDLIDRAIRDEELDAIENPEIKEKLKSDIAQLRTQLHPARRQHTQKMLSNFTEAKELIEKD